MDNKEYMLMTKTTAIYPHEVAIDYLILGLSSEVGEVLGVVKKYIRGDYPREIFLVKLRPELGDVLWYVSQLCNELKLDFSILMKEGKMLFQVANEQAEKLSLETYYFDNENSIFYKLNFQVGNIALIRQETLEAVKSEFPLKFYSDVERENIEKKLLATIACIFCVCSQYDFNINSLMQSNIEKLTKRRVNNTLKGDGDDR